MPAYPCNPGVFHYGSPTGGGSFRPRGKIANHGTHRNPEHWNFHDTWSGRIVGFNVGDIPTWSVKDLIAIVERVRIKQVGNPSSTFISQTGIYQHKDPAKGHVTEDGAQVIIINMNQTPPDDFRKQMVELAEVIAQEFDQEEVIVEIQHNGMSKETIGVSPY